MGFFRRSDTWLLILAGLVAPLSPAVAQTSGQFTLAGSFTYAYSEIKHGSTTFTAGTTKGGDVVSSGGGALFPEGKSFLTSCLVFSEKSADRLNLKAPCTFAEPEEAGGDQLFVVLTRTQGDVGAANRGGAGRADLVGGTGKYDNVTGQCSYETQYLSTSTAVMSYDCTWSKP